MGLDLMDVDLSRLVFRKLKQTALGEPEKQLDAVSSDAETFNSVWFVDECGARLPATEQFGALPG
jgi:hypothetical protein